ncbi:YeeE/YedE thiosulfate transporter family protein [Acinetobacter baumannii]
MGWGAMVALGCTVGTLLSGIMAAALSGWLFAASCAAGLVLAWSLRRRA